MAAHAPDIRLVHPRGCSPANTRQGQLWRCGNPPLSVGNSTGQNGNHTPNQAYSIAHLHPRHGAVVFISYSLYEYNQIQHRHPPQETVNMLDAVADHAKAHGKPYLIACDFNATPQDVHIWVKTAYGTSQTSALRRCHVQTSFWRTQNAVFLYHVTHSSRHYRRSCSGRTDDLSPAFTSRVKLQTHQ